MLARKKDSVISQHYIAITFHYSINLSLNTYAYVKYAYTIPTK